jgi:MFS transporter, DHA3 family, macrolide efflux protein
MAAFNPPPNGFRTFVIVWVTQSISVFGSALTNFALNIWLVTDLYPLPEQKPQLALAISATSLAFAVPALLLAPIAGAWADRHDRKRTMLGMDFASGLVSLALMLGVGSGTLQLGGLVLLNALASSLGTFHGSAFDTSYAMLVTDKQLPRANGMMQTMWSLSSILSPAAAAALISLPALARQGSIGGSLGGLLASVKSGGAVAMGVDAVTFFFAAAALLFLFIPSPKRSDMDPAAGKPKVSIWADVRQGARFIWVRRPMLWLLLTFTVANLCFAPLGVFEPLIVKFNLGPDWLGKGFTYEIALATITTATSLGGLAGGIIISAWGGLKRKRVLGVLGSILIFAVLLAAFGLSTSFYLSIGIAFLATMALPAANAHSQAIWQSITPHELQGRVFAVRRVIAQFAGPFATALAGLLAGVFNPGYVLAAMNVGLAIFMIFQCLNPALLRVEDKEYLESLAAKADAVA